MKKNRLNIRLFATLRERARASELTREYPEGTTVADVSGAAQARISRA